MLHVKIDINNPGKFQIFTKPMKSIRKSKVKSTLILHFVKFSNSGVQESFLKRYKNRQVAHLHGAKTTGLKLRVP